MLSGGHRGFRFARIDDDDFRIVLIAHDALPHDRMGDAEIRTDQDDDVRLFEIGVGVRRRVEPERFFVGRDGGGHALAGVAVAVDHPHAELSERSEEGHFFSDDLAGANPCDAFGSVFALHFFESFAEEDHGAFPIARFELAAAPAAEQRSRGAVGRCQRRQRFPPFGASHAEIDGIIGSRSEIDGLAVAQMRVESASG